ncbi:hypothetical protein HCN44_001585 [Aphidius gifuensis]|uniref:Coiled-coil domain-containing protein 13 n=1 Tax=Aphidius gifuensis TaxID=684658 RepID=A0A834XUF2_APHGI|nr:coiled-coil domain-containing protein 13 [Aphidius gifuensis]KAF7992260.1 hypothetical protein HCN44_001585 [Aphidius gifuensis]
MSSDKFKPADKKNIYSFENNVSFKELVEDKIPSSIKFSDKKNTRLYKISDQQSENGSLCHVLTEVEGVKFDRKNIEKPALMKNQLKNDDQVKNLREQLAQSNAKLYESKNACLSLRQELHKVQKLLQNEVGSNISISGLLNCPGNWKGRAQQIQQLQQKINDIQSKNDVDRSSRSASVIYDKKCTLQLKLMEQERKNQIETLTKELKHSEITLDDKIKKIEAYKARIKILENNINNSKRDIILLNEKKLHDNQLIEALNGQLRAVEGRYREKEMDLIFQKEKIQRDYGDIKKELGCSRLQVEQLRKKLHEREIEIDILKSSNNSLSESGKFSRPVSSKTLHDSPINTNRKNSRDSNEYVVLRLAAEAENVKLMELVALLNRRLDKERNDTDQISECLRKEKYKNAKLEKKIEKIEMTNNCRVNFGYRARCSRSSINCNSSKEELSVEKNQYKLELLEEECLALKARLATVQQEKINDLSMYKNMLDKTKNIIKDNYR